MTIAVTYASPKWTPTLPVRRFVRAADEHGARLVWCEQAADGYDYRQGTADGTDVPEDIRRRAVARRGTFPSYVEWPM